MSEDPAVPEHRSRRRPGSEIRALISASALAEFAQYGVEGATTRAIARNAGVAEHLIFRHFRSKSNLFREVVIKPFTLVFERFLESLDTTPDKVEARNQQVTEALFSFLRHNQALLKAIMRSSDTSDAEVRHALDGYFRISEQRLRLFYDYDPAKGGVPPALFVRYAFGMVASAVLFEAWFFPDGPIAETTAATALSRMTFNALQPRIVPSDDC